MMETLSSYEWMIMELLLLGFLVYEWFSIRRTIRRDREAKQKASEPKV